MRISESELLAGLPRLRRFARSLSVDSSEAEELVRETLERVLRDNPGEYAVVKLMPQVYVAVQAVVEEKINAFGSAGKAIR